MMHLNMAEHKPQNKQNVFEGFMSGLISRSSYQKCSEHDEVDRYEPGELGNGKGDKTGNDD